MYLAGGLQYTPGFSTKKQGAQWEYRLPLAAHWYCICGLSATGMKAAQNYKALYHNCTKQSAGKDSVITLLQRQLMQLVSERQSLIAIVEEQQGQLLGQAAQITNQQVVKVRSCMLTHL